MDVGPAWQSQLLRVTDAAEYLGISRTKLYQLVKAGEIETIKLGGSRRVTLGALFNYVRKLSEEE